MTQMENSAGSADAEMAKIEDSIQFKMNAFKQTWVGVTQNILPADVIKNFVDFFTVLSNIVDKFTEFSGFLGTLAIGGAAAYTWKTGGELMKPEQWLVDKFGGFFGRKADDAQTPTTDASGIDKTREAVDNLTKSEEALNNQQVLRINTSKEENVVDEQSIMRKKVANEITNENAMTLARERVQHQLSIEQLALLSTERTEDTINIQKEIDALMAKVAIEGEDADAMLRNIVATYEATGVLREYTGEVKNGVAVTTEMKDVDAKRVAEAAKMTLGIKEETSAMNNLNKALLGFGRAAVSMLIFKAISIGIDKFKELREEVEKTAESAKGFADEFTKNNSSIVKNQKSLVDLEKEYRILAEGVTTTGENISLTSEQYDRYKEVVGEISSILPNLTTYFNEQGEAIGFVKENLSDLNDEYKDEIRNRAKRMMTEGVDGKKASDTLKAYENLSTLKIADKRSHTEKELYTNAKKDMNALYALAGKEFTDITEQEKREAINAINNAVNMGLLDKSYEDFWGVDDEYLANLLGDPSQFNTVLNKLNAQFTTLESKFTDSARRIRASLITALQADDDLWFTLSDEEYDNYSIFLNNLSRDMIDTLGITSDNFDQKVNQLGHLFDDADSDLANAWKDLLALNVNEMATDDYETQAKALGTKISEALSQSFETDVASKDILSMIGINEESFGKSADKLTKLARDKVVDIKGIFEGLNNPDSQNVFNSFKSGVNEYLDDIEKLKIAYNNFRNDNLSEEDFAALKKGFPELKGDIDDLGNSIPQLIQEMNTNAIQSFSDVIGNFDTADSVESIITLEQAVLDLGNAIGSTDFNIDFSEEKKGMEAITTVLNAINSGSLQEIYGQNLTDKEVQNGKLTNLDMLVERYSKLKDYKYEDLFEEYGDGIRFNTEAIKKYEAEYNKRIIEKEQNRLHLLEQQSEAYDDIIKKMPDLNDDSIPDATFGLQGAKDEIDAEILRIKEEIGAWQDLTSAYTQYKNATSTSDSDVIWTDMATAYETMKQEFEKGRTGTDQFRAFLQYWTDTDLSNKTADELYKFFENTQSYIETMSKEGISGIREFANELEKIGSISGVLEIGVDSSGNRTIEILDDARLAAEMTARGYQQSTESVKAFNNAMKSYANQAINSKTAQSLMRDNGINPNSIKTILSKSYNKENDALYQMLASGVAEVANRAGGNKELVNYWMEQATGNSDIKKYVKEVETYLKNKEGQFAGTDYDTFEVNVDDYLAKMDTLKTALEKIANEDFSNKDFQELNKLFPELTGHSDDLEKEIKKLISSMNTDMVDGFERQFGKIDSSEDVKNLSLFREAVLAVGRDVANTAFSIDIETERNDFELLNQAISASADGVGLTVEQVEALDKRFRNMKGYDYETLFERTANGIRLNAEALRDLERQYEISVGKSYREELDTLEKEYNGIVKSINSLDPNTDALTLNTLYQNRDKVLEKIQDLQSMAAAWEGLTSKFNEYQMAVNTTDDDHIYEVMTSAYKSVKEDFDNGKVGTDQFRKYLEFWTDEDLTGKNAAELYEFFEKINSYVKQFEDGGLKGIDAFMTQLQKMGSIKDVLKVDKDSDGNLIVDVLDTSALAAKMTAKGMYQSTESIEAFLRAAQSYTGWNVTLHDAYADVDLLKTEFDELTESIEKATGEKFDFTFGSDNIGVITQQLSEAQGILSGMRSGEYGVVSDADIENVKKLIGYLVANKQSLNFKDILSIDTTTMSTELAEAYKLVNDYVSKYSEYEAKMTINPEAEPDTSALDKATKDLQAFADEHGITANVEWSTDYETVNKQLSNVMSNFATAQSTVESKEAETEKQTNELKGAIDDTSTSVDTLNQKSLSALWGQINLAYSKMKDFNTSIVNANNNLSSMDGKRISYSVTENRSSVTLGNGINGPRVNGTVSAYASGTGINPHGQLTNNQKALVNEVGTEGLIRDGKLTEIPGGAHIERLRKGDVILNHEQMQELREDGEITSNGGHGKLIGGKLKAFASGSDRKNTAGLIYGLGVSGKVLKKSSSKKKSSSNNKSDSKSKDSAEKFEEEIDWIETLIARLEREISRLDTTFSATWENWANRTSALNDDFKLLTKEIQVQADAAATYLQAANKVSLSAEYMKKVQDGTLAIETITNEDLKNKIDKYKGYYEQYLEALDKEQELLDALADKAMARLDLISSRYDKLLSMLDHAQSLLEGYIDLQESKGYVVALEYYNAILKEQEDQLDKNKSKYAELVKAREQAVDEGAVKKYSEAWYEMTEQINDAEEAILDVNKAIIETNNSMRELDWSNFELNLDYVDRLVAETEFLSKLLNEDKMFSKNGSLDADGITSMGLSGINYDIYMSKADEYARKIEEINKELANDPYNKTLIDKKNEYVEAQRDAIISARDEKDAIKVLVRSGYEKQLDYLGEISDKYSELLDIQKDAYDYQNQIAEKTKTIASYQKQIAALSGDGTEETKAIVQRLNVDLSEAMKDLQETEYDKWISDQKQILTDLSDEMSLWINERMDNFDFIFEDEIIPTINANANVIYSNINDKVGEVGASLSSELGGALASAASSISTDIDGVLNENGILIVNALNTEAGMITGITNLVSTYNSGFNTHSTAVKTSLSGISSLVQSMINNSANQATSIVNAINKQTEATLKKETVTQTTTKTGTSGTTNIASTSKSSGSSSGSSGSSSGSGSTSSSSGTKTSTSTKATTYSVTWKVSDGSKVLRYETKTSTISKTDAAAKAKTAAHDWCKNNKHSVKRDDSSSYTTYIYKWEVLDRYTNDVLSKDWLRQADAEAWLSARPAAIRNTSKIHSYAKGGKNLEDLMAWTQEQGGEIIRRSDGALLTPLGNGGNSMVFTNEMSQKLWEFAKDPAHFFNGFENLGGLGNSKIVSQSSNNIDFGGINIDKIVAENPQQFVEQLKYYIANDKNVKKICQEVVLGATMNKNGLNAKRYV